MATHCTAKGRCECKERTDIHITAWRAERGQPMTSACKEPAEVKIANVCKQNIGSERS